MSRSAILTHFSTGSLYYAAAALSDLTPCTVISHLSHCQHTERLAPTATLPALQTEGVKRLHRMQINTEDLSINITFRQVQMGEGRGENTGTGPGCSPSIVPADDMAEVTAASQSHTHPAHQGPLGATHSLPACHLLPLRKVLLRRTSPRCGSLTVPAAISCFPDFSLSSQEKKSDFPSVRKH